MCIAGPRADLAAEWHPLWNGDRTPHNTLYRSNARVWWQCKHFPEHVWTTRICDRKGAFPENLYVSGSGVRRVSCVSLLLAL